MMCAGFGIRRWGLGKDTAPTPMSAAFSTRFRIGLVIALASLAVACGSKSASKPATPFPEGNDVPGWTRVGETRTFQASNLWEYIDGDADRYIQAGVERTLTADYRYKEKIETLADIYLMKAPEGARKIFESESSVDSERINLGDGARLSKSSLTFHKGPYLVRLVAYAEAPDVSDALVALGRAIERKLGKTGTRD